MMQESPPAPKQSRIKGEVLGILLVAMAMAASVVLIQLLMVE